jgi:hypothetical protein
MTYILKNILFIVLPFFNFQEGKIHDFHTSLTEIQYNAKEKSLEVSIRVFTDDLESALTKLNNGQKVVVNAPNDKANPLVEKYIQQHFIILNPQKQRKTFTYIGKELEGDATWIYIEFQNCGDLQSNNHMLQNTILTELFDDQSNLVNFFYGKVKKTFLFNQRVKSEEIAW